MIRIQQTDQQPEEVQILKEFLDKECKEIDIDSWLNLFPKGVRSGGKLVKSDRIGCLKKMKALLKQTGYPWEIIMHATKQYIDEKEREDYAFMMCSSNFIHHRDKGSELAARVEELMNNEEVLETNIKQYQSDFI